MFLFFCLNGYCPSPINIVVRSLKNILFVLAAFAWLPMTSHCRLESVPGFESLACLTESNCHGEQSSEKPADAGCCSVEKSEYKTQQFRVTIPSPDLLPMSSVALLDLTNTLPAEVSIGILTAAPSGLTKSWQFSSRTALPVRAPSLAS
jgi:hypothetical protein